MKTILLVVILFVSIFGAHSKSSNRIIGGYGTNTTYFPYQVAIVQDQGGGSYSVFCGGSIISKDYILTAAHCFRDLSGNTNVDSGLSGIFVVSTSFIDQISNSKRYSVLQAFVHPQYSVDMSPENQVDICVLKVSTISFDQNTLPVVLAGSQDISNYPDGTTSYVSGFGLTNGNTNVPNRPTSNQMMAVNIPILSLTTCKSVLNANGLSVNFNIVCAGADGKDSCQGDSGGPLTVATKQNYFLQVGVVIFGTVPGSATVQCGANGNYGVYTDVSAYKNSFILPITGSLPSLGDPNTAKFGGSTSSSNIVSFAYPLLIFLMFYTIF